MRKGLLILGISICMFLYSVLSYAAIGDDEDAVRIECQPDTLRALPQNKDFVLEWQGAEWESSLDVDQGTYGAHTRIRVQVGESSYVIRANRNLTGAYVVEYEENPLLIMQFSVVNGNGVIYAYNPIGGTGITSIQILEEDVKKGIITTLYGYCFEGNLQMENDGFCFTVQRKGGIREIMGSTAILGDYSIIRTEISPETSTFFLQRPLILANTDSVAEDTDFFTVAAGSQVTFEEYRNDGQYHWYFVRRGEESGWFALSGDQMVFQNADNADVFSYREPQMCYVSPSTRESIKSEEILRGTSLAYIPDTVASRLMMTMPEAIGVDADSMIIGKLNYARNSQYDIYAVQYETDTVYCRLFINVNEQILPIKVEGQDDNALPITVFEEYAASMLTVAEDYHLGGGLLFPVGEEVYRLANFNELIKE